MTDKFCNGTLKLLGYPYIYTNISRKSKINTTSTTLKLYEKKKNEKRIIQQNYSFLVTQKYLKISRIFGLAKLFLVKVFV